MSHGVSFPVKNRSVDGGEVDVAIVGAGFAGLYMLYSVRALGLSAIVFERGSGVGGTWFWNRYPGARCDVESLDYSYSFSPELEQEWSWSERYPAQPEILRYLNHVADRFDLRRDIRLNTRVDSVAFDDDARRWAITTDTGSVVSAQYCVMATGMLSSAQTPAFPGIEQYGGAIYHTGQWPVDPVDFRGQRVGVIGTGSSGIQAIPAIARQAEHVTVFQRTPNFSVPAWNGPMDPEFERQIKVTYRERRAAARISSSGTLRELNPRPASAYTPEARHRQYERLWKFGGPGFLFAFGDIMTDRAANETAAEFVRQQIRSIVADPDVAERLGPRDHPIGSKRICVDIDYYSTYNRDNVDLVDLRQEPIVGFTATALKTKQAYYELDSVVCATGFDAMTGALLAVDIRGRQGLQLREKWAAGPRTYLGLSTAGFPNLFIITGPGSPSVLSNMVTSIEQHVEWVTRFLAYACAHGIALSEADLAAEDKWVDHVNDLAAQTLFILANSWYLGANVPGKPRVFMPFVGGVGHYRAVCDDVAANDYRGFVLTPATAHESLSLPASPDQGPDCAVLS